MQRPMMHHAKRTTGLMCALSALCAWALCACGSGSGSAPSGSASATPPAQTAAACTSNAIVDPPACKLAARQITDAAFGPDHATVIVATSRTGGEDGLGLESDEIWDARAGRFVATLAKDLERHGGLETAWSADRKRAAIIGVGDSKFGYGLYDTSSWRAISRNVDVSFAFPCDLAVDPKGSRVAVTTLIGQAWIDDMATGKSLGSAGAPTNERAAGHVCNPLAWGGDGELVLIEGLRKSRGMRPVPRPARVPEEIQQMTPAPAGDGVAYLDMKGTLAVFSKHGAKPLGKPITVAPDIPVDSADRGPALGFAWTPDASAITTWDSKGRVRLWDPRTGTQTKEIKLTTDNLYSMMGPDGEETRLAWAPDGRSFVFEVEATGPELWSVEGQGGRLKLPADAPMEQGFQRPSMSPDGARVLVGTHLFDAKTGAFVREVPAYSTWVEGSKYLQLATVYDDSAPLRVMRLSDGAILNIARLGDDEKPTLLAYTEDGVFQGPPELAGCLWLTDVSAPVSPPAAPSSAPSPSDSAPPTGASSPPPPSDSASSTGATSPAPAAKPKRPAPEPRATLLADFWADRPVKRTCPSP